MILNIVCAIMSAVGIIGTIAALAYATLYIDLSLIIAVVFGLLALGVFCMWCAQLGIELADWLRRWM